MLLKIENVHQDLHMLKKVTCLLEITQDVISYHSERPPQTAWNLLNTAKLNGLDPEVYLRHGLSKIADHPVNRVDEFLQWNVTLEKTVVE